MNPELLKIISDYSLYAQSFLKIRNKEGLIVPLKFNAPQWRYHLFKQQIIQSGRPVRIIICKYRQGGFTTYEQGDSFWRASTRLNQNIIMVGNIEDTSKEIFVKMNDVFYNNLPDRVKNKRKIATHEVSFPELNSTYTVGWSGADHIGTTFSKVHCTEFAYWIGDPAKQLSKLLDTTPLSAHVVIESTPNGYNEFYNMYFAAKRGEGAFVPFFIRWFDDPQYQIPLLPGENLEPYSTDEEHLIRAYRLSAPQIKWRRWKISEKNGSLDDFWEKYPEDDIQCFIASGSSYFNTKKIVQRAVAFAEDNPPIREDKSLGLRVWEDPQDGLSYIGGADPAEGINGDYSAFHLIEELTGRTVLTLRNNRMSPHEFADRIYGYATRYNNAYLVPEANNHGHTVIDVLINKYGYAKKNQLYYHSDYTEDLKPLRYRQKKSQNKSYKPGFQTKSNTKPQLLDNYKNIIEDMPECILDTGIIDEIKTYQRMPNGKLGAEAPNHDDGVTAHALAFWGRSKGRPNDTFVKEYKVYHG